LVTIHTPTPPPENTILSLIFKENDIKTHTKEKIESVAENAYISRVFYPLFKPLFNPELKQRQVVGEI